MTPAECIADLDAFLASDGEDITIERMALSGGAQTVAQSVTCRAAGRQRGAGNRSQDLAGQIRQGDVVLVLSPTEIIAAAWTSGRVSGDDQRVPRNGNRIIRAGRTMTVDDGFGIYVRGELVRIEIIARG